MTDSHGTQSDSSNDEQLSPELIGIAAGAVDVPVFAYVALQLFGNPVFGAFVGFVVGLGTYLFLPAVMADDRDGDSDEFEPTDVRTRLRGFHRTAAGLALPPAGIMLFAWRFVSENILLGILITTVIALAIYVPLAVLLPRRLA